MTSFTPGPWTVKQPHMGFSAIHGPNGELIFGIAAGHPDEKRPDDECDANARLIASAPDLLAALKRAQAILETLDTVRHIAPDFPALDEVRAAIAKAEGNS